MRYYDFETVAREAGIPQAKMNVLRDVIRREFPRDDMMYELHMLRACMVVRDALDTRGRRREDLRWGRSGIP
ncbi:MAG: hypothetical protein AMS14_06390 [Planctomycetes bacterium DG_20]|nr:MAG: hypothetical protein AMS14_06390 [Planctomycetes bacterium DG_20]